MSALNFSRFKHWPRLTRLGVYFPTLDITWVYPWRERGGCYYDHKSGTELKNRLEFVEFVAPKRISGLSLEKWLTETTALLPDNTVLLADIDLTKKPNGFWLTMPQDVRRAFQQDIVLLSAANAKEAYETWATLEPEFCLAILKVNGDVALNREQKA